MRIFRWLVGLAGFFPLFIVAYNAVYSYDVADPVKYLTKYTGGWAIGFMLLTLSITPLRKLTSKQWLFPYRAIFGRLFFLYAFCHAIVFFALANAFNINDIVLAIQKSKPIIFGLTALMMLAPLMATTGHFMIKKLGHAKWRRIHFMIYPASILSVLHYITVVKKDIRMPALVVIAVIILLGFRLYKHRLSLKSKKIA